jgi:hypothetical protein
MYQPDESDPACDEGCCLPGRDPEFWPEPGSLHVRPMFQILTDYEGDPRVYIWHAKYDVSRRVANIEQHFIRRFRNVYADLL